MLPLNYYDKDRALLVALTTALIVVEATTTSPLLYLTADLLSWYTLYRLFTLDERS